ncbi:MAG TPA: DUF1549 domain-containing protein [Polyangia bacterium]|nr:DUF1549 domain-containing protein [Polyangia bacterium]
MSVIAVVAALAASAGAAAGKAPAKPAAPKELTPAELDKMIAAEWRKARVQPAIPVDDARFLRRVYIDLTGAIPPANVVAAFLADKSADKRVRAVNQLLDGPSYADHFTDYWDKVLLGRFVFGNLVDRPAFRAWLHDELDRDEPWSVVVEKLLTASGQNTTPDPKGGKMPQADGKMPQADAKPNGAVNWLLKYNGNPTDLTGKVSRVFLGVQIQCAQCHDHPSEKWKQDDFRRLAACFARTGMTPLDDGKQPGIRRVELHDTLVPSFGGPKKSELREIADAKPTALDGSDFSTAPSRRKALAAWIVAPANPYFARAIVNRFWAYFLGRGFFDPVDDFRRSNPVTAPEILDRLSADFVTHGYSLRRLIAMITATRAYQLAAAPAKGPGDAEDKLWGHYRLRPMGPESLLDSIAVATDVERLLSRFAGANIDKVKTQVRQLVTFLFDVDEEIDASEYEGTIPQSLMLINGQLLNSASSALPGTALTDVLAMPVGDAAKIEALYLRTLSRPPTAKELERWTAFVNAEHDVVDTGKPKRPPPRDPNQKGNGMGGKRGEPPDPLRRIGPRIKIAGMTAKQQAYEDLEWALLNSSEFFFRH